MGQRKNTELAGTASRIPAFFIIAALTATAAGAQQVPLPNRGGICATARTAAARLICADPELSARDAKLAAAYRQKKNHSPLAEQSALLKEQLLWMRQRDQKCGLVGKDAAPLAELREAKPCVESELDARLAELQNPPPLNTVTSNPVLPPSAAATPGVALNEPTSTANAPAPVPNPTAVSTNSVNSLPTNQDIIIAPLVQQTAIAAGAGQAASSLDKFRFSASASHISGTADCGTPSSHAANGAANASLSVGLMPTVKIELADDANSYQLFENDSWRVVLDEVREAVHSACLKALSASNNGSQTTTDLDHVYEVNSSAGLFVAHGTGLTGPWSVTTNVPQTRKKLQSDLGIEKWIKPSQLARNPYFFKDEVVGMVVQLDHKISDTQAVFVRSSAQIFVAGVPKNFTSRDMMVLAGRVVGNKGVVDQSGSEQLMPAVDYIGTADCTQACEALAGLATP